MRFVHELFSKSIEWNEYNHVSELVIESPSLFRSIIKDFTTNNEDKKLNLLDTKKPLKFETDIEVIFNPMKLDFNNRRAITALLKNMLRASLSEDFYLPTNELKTRIVKYISEIIDSENYIFEVESSDFMIDSIAKATDIHIVGDEDNFVELLTDYVSMMTELVHTKLFIFINLRSFLNFAELNQFIANLNNHQIDVLFVENIDHERLKNLNRIVIDSDLCEI